MGASQRRKGAAGERELQKVLTASMKRWATKRLSPEAQVVFGCMFTLDRNLQQSIRGGYDLQGIPTLAVECKRREQLSLPSWWKQTLRQAEAAGKTPVLAYRRSREQWQYLVPYTPCHGEMRKLRKMEEPVSACNAEAFEVWLHTHLDHYYLSTYF